MADQFEASANMLYLHESTVRRTFSGEEAGNEFPDDVHSFTSGGEAQAWGEGVANLGIGCAIVGLVFLLLLLLLYTLALCCNCCGGDRTQACCCPAKRKTVRPDALSAQPAYAHDDGMPDAEKGGGDSGLTIGGTHIPEATMSKYTLAFLILCMVIYFVMCCLVYGGVGAVGQGVNSMVDGFGGVVDIMDDLGDIVNDASFTVAQLSGNISALGAEVKSVNQPGTDDLADRVWVAGNTTQDTSDLLSSASSIVGTFGSDITRQLDDFKSQVDAYAVTVGMAYASVLAVSVVFMAVTLLPIGLCTCCYKVSVVPNFLLIFLLWLVTGVLMVLSTGLSDMCLNPGPSHSIVSIANSTNAVSGEVMDTLEYYLLCEPGVNGTNEKGLYKDIVRFQNDALSASRSVESVKDDVQSQTASFPPGPRDDINRRLGVVQEGVWGMGNVTVDLVRLASCESLGGRVYRPVIKALCEDFVGKGFASLWAVHVAAGVFLALILVAGVRLCNANRHPGGSKSREAVKARALAAQSTLSGTNPVATAHPVQAQPASVSGGAVELSPEHHSQPLASAPGQPFADHVVRK